MGTSYWTSLLGFDAPLISPRLWLIKETNPFLKCPSAGASTWDCSSGDCHQVAPTISSQCSLLSALLIELGPLVDLAFGAQSESALGHCDPRRKGKLDWRNILSKCMECPVPAILLDNWIMAIAYCPPKEVWYPLSLVQVSAPLPERTQSARKTL